MLTVITCQIEVPEDTLRSALAIGNIRFWPCALSASRLSAMCLERVYALGHAPWAFLSSRQCVLSASLALSTSMLDFDFTVGTLYTALSGERRPPPIHSVLIVADSSASALISIRRVGLSSSIFDTIALWVTAAVRSAAALSRACLTACRVRVWNSLLFASCWKASDILSPDAGLLARAPLAPAMLSSLMTLWVSVIFFVDRLLCSPVTFFFDMLLDSIITLVPFCQRALNVMIFFSIMLIQLNTPCLIFSTGVHTRPHAQIITRLWIKIGMARLKDKISSRRLLSHIFEKGLYNIF